LIKLEHQKPESFGFSIPVPATAVPEEPLKTSNQPHPLSGYPKTLIVIPSFNEEKNIGAVLEGIKLHFPEAAILVIDDGSKDATAQVAEAHGARVILLPYNSGYGVALQTGFIYALQHEYSVVVQMDGDGQHDSRYIQKLLQEVQKEDVDVVIGSRFIGPEKYKTSFVRRAGMVIFSKLASLGCGQKISDPTSGFQALKGEAIRFVAGEFYPPDYPDADFLIMLHRNGFKMREIPVKMHANPDNRSMHRGHRTVYYVFKMFLSIFVTLLRTKFRR